MALSDRSDPVASPGLFVSLRTFWGVAVSILHTRLDLVTMELEEEAARAVKLVLVALGALFCMSAAFLFAMIFFLALIWNTVYRLPVLGGVFLIFALGAFILVLIARQMILHRPKFLSQTLAELKKDVDKMQPLAKSLEPKP